jgi:hypothetical protein
MFAYPRQAEFNRVVPKTKIYAHAKVSRRIREYFVTQVDEIMWKYKLAPETINLPARNGIHEIQIFEITQKTAEFDETLLQVIDKAIPFPLLFQLVYDGRIRFAASYKRPSDADKTKWVIEGSFQTAPQPLDAERPPLPVALDLASLYEQMVSRHIPLPARSGERVAEQVTRYAAIEARQRTKQQLESQLASEKQFNRKVELNATLRSLSHELEILTGH